MSDNKLYNYVQAQVILINNYLLCKHDWNTNEMLAALRVERTNANEEMNECDDLYRIYKERNYKFTILNYTVQYSNLTTET